jgi:ATP-dependent DNA helicase RecQ
VLALMPTGGGKSLCYQVPSLVRPGTGVVVSPLIALMQDQVDALKQLGVAAAFLNSTQSLPEQRAVEQQFRMGELDLLYVAPERLVSDRMMELISAADVALFALDEAHCVSQWGHDFRPEYRKLSVLAERFPHVPRIALTATADSRTRAEIVEQLGLGEAAQFVASFDRPNIRYGIPESTTTSAKERLWRFIRDEHPESSGIVYCLRRKDVEETAEFLKSKGRKAIPYHAGLDQEVRRKNQQRFLREDNIIVAATIAFGMGIDKPDVRFVGHLNLPKSVEAYYQETGRAGRDGEPAEAWMSYSMADVTTYRQWITDGQASEAQKRVEMQKLDALVGLCEATCCRREVLLGYFGETFHGPCGACDNCLDPPITEDRTEAARMALSAIYRTDQRFGFGYLIQVLRGQGEARIAQNGHDKLSVFGLGKDTSEIEWRRLFRQLMAQGHILQDLESHGSIKLTPQCRPLLRGESRFALRVMKPVERKEKRGAKEKTPAVKVKPEDQALWEALRALRSRLAAENDVPPYVIFHDRSIADLVAKRPVTTAALGEVTGFGSVRVERIGPAVLAVVAEHPRPAKP